MKTTFSYFPGMFKNPAPGVKQVVIYKYYLKTKKNIMNSTLYECIERLSMIIGCNI